MELWRPGLTGMGLASALALLVMVLGALSGRRSLPMALGLAFAIGHAAVRGWLQDGGPPWPPLDATDWVPWLALLAMTLGLLESVAPCPAWARWENRILLTALMLGLVLRPLLAEWLVTVEGVGWLLGVGLGILAAWGVLESQAERLGRAILLPMVILAIGTAGVLLLSHSLVLASSAAVLAAALAACGLVMLWRGEGASVRGGVPVVVVVLAGLILSGHIYAFPALPGLAAVGLAAAPLALGVDRVGPGRWLGPRGSALIRLVAVLVVVGVALAITAFKSPIAGPTL